MATNRIDAQQLRNAVTMPFAGLQVRIGILVHTISIARTKIKTGSVCRSSTISRAQPRA